MSSKALYGMGPIYLRDIPPPSIISTCLIRSSRRPCCVGTEVGAGVMWSWQNDYAISEIVFTLLQIVFYSFFYSFLLFQCILKGFFMMSFFVYCVFNSVQLLKLTAEQLNLFEQIEQISKNSSTWQSAPN